MQNTPLVSIITVCYNTATTIEETILSVLNQTYPSVEYIIIDGGSTDGTVEIIKKYADRIAYWVSEPDKGIYDAMNKGIAAATGEYLNFMNAGDIFYGNNVLAEFVPRINSDSIVAYGDTIFTFRTVGHKIVPVSISQLPKRMVFCHQSAFTQTAFHKQHPFLTTFRSASDYKFFYDAYLVYNATFQYIPIVVAVFDNTTGMSKDNYKVSYCEQLIIRNEKDSLRKKLRIMYNHHTLRIKSMLPAWVVKLSLILRNRSYIDINDCKNPNRCE